MDTVAADRPPPQAVELLVATDDVDLASGLLWAGGVTAVAEHPDPDGATVRLRADVPEGGVDGLRAVLGDRWALSVITIDDDGLDAWRDHAEVVEVGRLVVRPPWRERPSASPAPGTVEITVDPGRAFGHGAHPTTRLCLSAVDEALASTPGATVLDVGCGSGVLAVAAAALGAGRVVAVDVDPEAIDATATNAAANGVDAAVDVHLVDGGAASVGPVSGPFDVVVANIGARALVELSGALVAALAPEGTLVLSGLLDPPPPEVAAACAPLVLVATDRLDGWTALRLRHPA